MGSPERYVAGVWSVMANKAPSPNQSKKPGKSLMEKRAVKKAKQSAKQKKAASS
jgi:hypothetical protein